MELILIRHGLPERRDDTSDPPLSPVGEDQARRVADWPDGVERHPEREARAVEEQQRAPDADRAARRQRESA